MNNTELKSIAKQLVKKYAATELSEGYKPAGLHPYSDENGNLIYFKIRLKHSTGRKWIKPFYFDDASQDYVMREPKHKFSSGKPLYRLPELLQNPSSEVWLVEGETCVEALEKLGILATTSGSSTSTDKTNWEPLRDRTITLWPDNDQAGQLYVENILPFLHSLNCRIRIVDVEKLQLPEGGDCVDWLAANPTATQQDVLQLPIIELPEIGSPSPLEAPYLGAVLTRLSDINPENIDWLWPGFIARGKLSLIAGDPGLGKSLVTLYMAATITQGKAWPLDGGLCSRGDVILLSCEDDPADTIRPRLDAAGADVNRVHLLSMIREINCDATAIESRIFSLRHDINELAKCLEKLPECKLIIIDPITAYSDGVDTHKNADVRALLTPLAALARQFKVAILCVTHLSKNSNNNVLGRLSGSIAFGAAARFVFVVAKDPNNQSRRLLLQAKNNLGKDSKGLAYSVKDINDVPIIEWENQYVTISPEEAFSSQIAGKRSELNEAIQWLQETLSEGELPQHKIETSAEAEGFSKATLQRAKNHIGIKSRKEGYGKESKWHWELPKVLNKTKGAQP